MLSVVVGTGPSLLFERPAQTIRAAEAAELPALWDRAEAALERGWWIAGYVPYEGAGATLGVFGAPREMELPDPPSVRHAPLLARVERDAYDAAISSLQRAIYDGDVYQVNYTIPLALTAETNPFELYGYYARRSGATFQAYVFDGDRAILSWSPELFLEFDGTRLRTKPMKGTAPLEASEQLRDSKNRAEHVMIVDLLRNDLRRVCDEVDVERFLEIERYPTYATMTSTLAGNVRAGTTLKEIFAATFPCGSVTGAPKRAAMRFIASHEARPRGAYCGSIGYLSPQRRGWWNVAIRTAQLDTATNAGHFDAGGGIVADSTAVSEWTEIFVKSRFLRPDGDFAILQTFAAGADDDVIELHIARLLRSAAAFGIPCDERKIAAALRQDRGSALGGRNTIRRVRLNLDGALCVRDEAGGKPQEPVRVCLSTARVRSDDPFLAHKTSWRPAHEAAMREANERGCFEALLRNERGELTEGWRTNLFVERDGTLLTPALTAGLLHGVLRERLLERRAAREAVLTPADLRGAVLYCGNSARGLLRAELAEFPA